MTTKSSKILEGMVVRLRSGGPLMTVEKIDTELALIGMSNSLIECAWFYEYGQEWRVERASFQACALKIVRFRRRS